MAYCTRYGWRTMTKAQQLALKKLYDRIPYKISHGIEYKVTYRKFRKSVVNSFDCMMVEWAGMWIGIERDGYTHS